MVSIRAFRSIIVMVLMITAWCDISAQPQRTFVSAKTGSDGNPCSRDLPCRNFLAAVTAAAVNGEVIVLDSGGYGPVTISKSISLIAPSGVYAGITVFSGDGINSEPGPTGVVRVSGLSLNSLGGARGIVSSGQSLSVESCAIDGFTNMGVFFVGEAGYELSITDSVFREGYNHVRIHGGKAVLDRNRFEGWSNIGVYVTSADVMVRNSVAAQGNGAFLSSNGSVLMIENSAAFNNSIWGVLADPGTVLLSNSIFTRNGTGVFVSGGGIAYSFGNNAIHGNTSMDVNGALTPASTQ
jgi:parallel beta helix pectate lyase-like protein